MTPILWRKAVPGDEDALSLLGQATFLATFAFDHPGEPLIRFLKEMHGTEFYAAKLNDPYVDIIIGETPMRAPVAYAMLCPPEHADYRQADDWELKRIYLLEPWQGSGNGKALMDRAVQIARDRGANRLLLAVYESNERGIAFYKRNGFEQVGQAVFMVAGVPFRDMLFARQLRQDRS
jgi:GNAT superfamily N-acetyltransferase